MEKMRARESNQKMFNPELNNEKYKDEIVSDRKKTQITEVNNNTNMFWSEDFDFENSFIVFNFQGPKEED